MQSESDKSGSINFSLEVELFFDMQVQVKEISEANKSVISTKSTNLWSIGRELPFFFTFDLGQPQKHTQVISLKSLGRS